MSDNTMLKAALRYAAQGLAVSPFHPKSKVPSSGKGGFNNATTDETIIRKWWGDNPDHNIAITAGKPSENLVVLDFDEDEEKGKHGLDVLRDWEREHGELPETVRVLTPRGGLHLYYYCDRTINKCENEELAVDIRGQGSCAMVPPSIHPNGKIYEFEAGYSPDEIPIAKADSNVYELIKHIQGSNKTPGTKHKEAAISHGDIKQGERVSALVRLIGIMSVQGMSKDAIRAAIVEVNKKQCKPPLSDKELEKSVFPALNRGWGRYSFIQKSASLSKGDILSYLKEAEAVKNYPWNDKGNGSLFADVFKDRLRFNVTAKQWYWYNGKIWKEDTGGMKAAKYAKRLYDALVKYAFSIRDSESGDDKYLKHVMSLGSLNARKRMIEDARDKYCVSAEDFDKEPYLLNVQNCVLDLREYPIKVIEHDPELLLSKICNASYNPDVTSERFNQFIDEVMCGNKAKIQYLQKIHGYALTADTREETCFIYYGATTRNGKSTLVETIGYMMGQDTGYALNMAPETLALKRKKDTQRASGDIARLHNCRFLNASEPPKRMIFDVALLKTLLGRDRITARHLCQSEFEFIPCFKLIINTNYLPMITDDSLFSSGRINVVTFDRHFEPAEQDKSLKDILKEPGNMSGILNWCLDGLKMYYSEGLTPPKEVAEANNSYRADSDKIGKFILDRLEEAPGTNTKIKDVYSEYCRWCRDNGYGIENKGNFIAELKNKGMYSKSGTIHGVTYQNVVCGYMISTDFMDVKDEEDLPFND